MRVESPIDLVDDHDVDPAGSDVEEELLQRRPLRHWAAAASWRRSRPGRSRTREACGPTFPPALWFLATMRSDGQFMDLFEHALDAFLRWCRWALRIMERSSATPPQHMSLQRTSA